MAKHLIVGEEDCRIKDIANVLKDDKIVFKQWKELGRELGMSGAKIAKLKKDDKLDKLTLYDIIENILENWKQRLGSRATLSDLVGCMDVLKWCHISELLSKTYGIPYVPNDLTFATKRSPRKFMVDDPVELFTGRHSELVTLHEKLTGSSSTNANTTVITQRAAISGLGGIGKTELAKQYIYLYGNHFNNILWINSETEPSMQQSFRGMAKDELKISLKDADGEEKDIFTVIRQVYRALEGSKILVVFDNAEMPIKTFKQYLPTSQRGEVPPTILLTSRNREWDLGFTINIISIDELKMGEGIEFVKRGLNLINDDQTDQIKELLNMLQCFPLAIQQAISYINENVVVHGSYSIADYMDQFNRSKTELLNSDLFQESNKYTQTTFTTWNVTMKIIAKDKDYGTLAKRIFDIIAYMAPDNIPHKFFLHMCNTIEAKYSLLGYLYQIIRSFIFSVYPFHTVVNTDPDLEHKVKCAIRLLVKYSMLNEISGTSVSVHRLVQEVTMIRLKETEKEYSVLQEAMELLTKADKNDLTEQGPTIWKYAQQHTQVVKTHSKIPLKITQALHDGYKYDEAYIYYKETVDKLKEVLTERDKITLSFQALNGRYLYNIGRGDEGFSILKHVVEKQKQILGSEHPDTLATMHNIAGVLDKQGKSDEALSMYKEVLEKNKQILGSHHPEPLTTMHNIAGVLNQQGKSDEALSMNKEVLEKRKQILGSDNPDTLTTMNNMAFVLNKQGKSDEALSIFKEVLEKKKHIFGSDNPDTLTTMHIIADVLNEQGKGDETLSMLKEVLEKNKQILGSNHPDTLTTMNNIAHVLNEQGKSDEALSMYKEVLKKQTQILGSVHPDTLGTMHNMADVLDKQGKSDEALSVFKEVLEKRKTNSWFSSPWHFKHNEYYSRRVR